MSFSVRTSFFTWRVAVSDFLLQLPLKSKMLRPSVVRFRESHFDREDYILRLDDGKIIHVKVFVNDLVNVAHNTGVYLYDDLFGDCMATLPDCTHSSNNRFWPPC